MSIGIRTIAAIAVIATAGAASSSVDRSPKPGGVYRLKPGVYVAKGSNCGNPANAALRTYDGKGLSDAHSRACRVRILSRRGNAFVVDQSCIGAGAGPAPRYTQRQTVTVQDALDFTLRTKGPATSYRYCPAFQLPADLRDASK
jgi:hypothetical protein